MRTIRGLLSLIHDAVDGVVDLVDEGHESTARNVVRAASLVPGLEAPTRAVDAVRRVSTRAVLGTVKAVNRVVQVTADAGFELAGGAAATSGPALTDGDGVPTCTLEMAVPMRSDALSDGSVVADALLGVLNGAVGDKLFRDDNALDLGLSLRVGDHYLDLRDSAFAGASLRATVPDPPRRVVVFVHGLMATEWSWVLEAERYHGNPTTTFGSLLARDLGVLPVYVRYNSGRRISANGRALDDALDAFVEAYPGPLDELVLVGHSMGGLVLRSAMHYARAEQRPWVARVRRVVCLGTPHQGAPLERLGERVSRALAAIDLPGTQIPARILERRSEGIRDLAHGALVEAHWAGVDPAVQATDPELAVELSPDVVYTFVGGTVTADPEHPLSALVGDLLVRSPSAAGPVVVHGSVAIERARFGGILHHQLQNHPDVYEVVRRACAGEPVPAV